MDAIFLAYGGLIMISVFLELARILGQRAPIFGMICAVAGISWGLMAMQKMGVVGVPEVRFLETVYLDKLSR